MTRTPGEIGGHLGKRRVTRAVPVLAFAALLAAGPARAEEARVDCQVLYETQEGLYVDAGSGAGLRDKTSARLERDGERIAQVEVVKVSSGSTFLRMVARQGLAPRPGETLSLVFDRAAAGETPRPKDPSPTVKSGDRDEEPFVPLLAPLDLGSTASTEARNIFHGRLTLRQLYQVTGDGDNDASITSLRSSGSVERIDGTPWTFEWSMDLSYRALEGLEDVRDFEEPRFDTYRLALYRRFDDRSFLRLGRFIPLELPSAGYMDGVQAEKVLDESWRVGGIIGFKPGRDDLVISVDEPTAVPYVTVDAGSSPDLLYSGTFGLLASLYDGEPDRLAFLAEQSLTRRKLNVLCSSEVDFDIGGAVEREGVRFTRLDLVADYALSPGFSPRAGIDHYELPDTQGERTFIDPQSLQIEEFFQDSWWRYWVGASHELPWGLRLSEEVGWIESEIDEGVRWVVTLTRAGLPWVEGGSISISAFNIDGVGAEGYGGRLSAFLPVLQSRLLLTPSAAFRYASYDTEGANFFTPVSEDIFIVDVSLRGQWIISSSWDLLGGVSYTFNDDEDRVLVDFALSFKW